MEETQQRHLIGSNSTTPTQVSEKIIIEAETIFKAALAKLGTKEHSIRFETTHDKKYFAVLDVQINRHPHTENPKRTTVRSYFHDTIEGAREDVYSEAVSWLQSEENLILDVKANQQLKETKHRLKMSAAMEEIMEEKYTKIAAEAERMNSKRKLAVTEMIAAAEKFPTILTLVENTTPLKPNSAPLPHMVYMGQDPPRSEKEQLAECLCKVYTLLKLP